MERVTLHVSGSIQRAGYRSRVVTIATAFGIRGSIQNLPDGRVKIIAEGGEADLERFIQAVDIKNTLINVTSIEKEYSTPSGDYESFFKLVGGGETDERLDTAADLLKELIHIAKNGFEEVGGKVDGLGDKIDGLEKSLGGKIDGLEKSLGGKIDQSREEITSEIHSLGDGFRSHFDERLTNVEFELAEIKAKVSDPVTALPLPPNPKTRTPPAKSASTSTPAPATSTTSAQSHRPEKRL